MQDRSKGLRNPALIGALALGLLLTACVGPTVIDPSTGSAGGFTIAVRTDPVTIQAGQKATLDYFFSDAKGQPVTTLATVSGTPLQVFVVDRQLGYHVHATSPGAGPANAYPVNVLLSHEGTYYAFAEFAPSMVVTDTTGKKATVAGPMSILSTTISFGTGGQVEAAGAALHEDLTPKNAGGVAISLTAPSPIQAGQPATLAFTLSELGTPIQTLALFLGSAGHVFVLDATAQSYAHLLARESAGAAPEVTGSPPATPVPGSSGGTPATPAATATTGTLPGGFGIYHPPPTAPPSTALGGGIYGPVLTFQHTFPAPGLYKLFAEFFYRGQIISAPFTVRVQ